MNQRILIGAALADLRHVRYLESKGLAERDLHGDYRCLWGLLLRQVEAGKYLDLADLVRGLEKQGCQNAEALVQDLMAAGRALSQDHLDGALIGLKRETLRLLLMEKLEEATSAVARAEDPAAAGQEAMELMADVYRLCARDGQSDQGTLKAYGVKLMQSLARRGYDSLPGIPSFLPGLNRLLGGYEPSTLTLVCGRPGMGKTALALNESLHLARFGKVLYFSLEMSGVQLVRRSLATLNSINAKKVRDNKLEGAELVKLSTSVTNPVLENLVVVDASEATPNYVRRVILQHAKDERLAAVLVDHLHLMKADGENARMTTTDRVSSVAINFKKIAKQFELPLLALAQLNKDAERKADGQSRRPQLADIRQAGEAEADNILMLHRPDYQEEGGGESLLEVIIAKGREGETSTIRCNYNRQTQKIQEVPV